MAVLYRRIFGAKHYIFAVQGRGHLQKRQAVSHFLNCSSIADHVIQAPYLRSEISFYEVLIPLHLHRAVTSDRLVVIAWNGIVECIHAYIEHSIIEVLVL